MHTPVAFYCPLNSDWPELLSDQALKQQHPALNADLFQLNPWLHLQTEQSQDWCTKAEYINYANSVPIIWLKHPIFAYPEAYWPDQKMLHVLQNLAAGAIQLKNLDANIFSILTAAHILILKPVEIYSELRKKIYQSWQKEWHNQGYIYLPNLISSLQIAALRTYLRQSYQHKELIDEDDDYTQRKYLYDDHLTRFMHRNLSPILEQILMESVRSTYSIISYYQETWLRPHKDRSPCLWNLSLQADSNPEYQGDQRWALWLNSKLGERPVYLNLGDAVLYSGNQTDHGRDALEQNRRETMVLFHFVNQDYSGQMW